MISGSSPGAGEATKQRAGPRPNRRARRNGVTRRARPVDPLENPRVFVSGLTINGGYCQCADERPGVWRASRNGSGNATPGGREPAGDGLPENLVAAALYASASDRLTQAEPLPGAIGYWKSRDGRETDSVVPIHGDGRGYDRIPVEVEGDSRRGISAARPSMRRSFGRGIVVTGRVFEPEEIPAIPIGVFLAGLAPRAERKRAEL